MNQRDIGPREVALPATAFAALDRALTEHAGALARVHTLHAAGYAAGASLWDAFDRPPRTPVPSMTEGKFWESLRRFLEARGWGTLTHETPHAGVGLLQSRDWAEAAGRSEPQPVCAFSTGLLSHLLTLAAAQPVAVLEVSCRGRGDDRCAFAFGSETTIHDLYGLLLEGSGLETALADL
jgi:hypothetical protein